LVPGNAVVVSCDLTERIIAESLIEAGWYSDVGGCQAVPIPCNSTHPFVGKVIIEYSRIEEFDVILMALGK